MTNELNMKYKKICKKNDFDPDEDEKKKEIKGAALATISYPRFNGRCYVCENFGHQSVDCPNKRNDSENDTNKNAKRFNGRCTHCGRWGHKRVDYWYYNNEQERQKNNNENADVTSETITDKDVALITDAPNGSETALLCTEICKDVRIADSGASSHMTNTLQGMYNQRTILSKAKIDSGEYVDAHIMGDVSDVAIQKDGTKKDITLRNIKYAPCLFCILISLTTIMIRGFKMTGNGHGITLEKASTSYTFDQRIKSSDGELIWLEIELGNLRMQTYILEARMPSSGTQAIT